MIDGALPAGALELRLFDADPFVGAGTDGVIISIPRGDAARAAILADECRELRLENRQLRRALELAEDELDWRREAAGMGYAAEVPS